MSEVPSGVIQLEHHTTVISHLESETKCAQRPRKHDLQGTTGRTDCCSQRRQSNKGPEVLILQKENACTVEYASGN